MTKINKINKLRNPVEKQTNPETSPETIIDQLNQLNNELRMVNEAVDFVNNELTVILGE